MSKNTSFFGTLIDFLEITFVGVTVFIVVYLFVGQLLEVTGESMDPNFKDKEQIIAEKVSIKFKPLERGEVVIFRHPKNIEKLLIKRVIGLPGEVIKTSEGFVYINNEKLSEPYLQDSIVTKSGESLREGIEYTIAANAYVFLGDNRSKSTDSRDWGAVPAELVIGRGLIVYYPIQSIRLINGIF